MNRTGVNMALAFAWAASVGVVLADSSIVTLALPEILREYDTTVFGVSWVLTSFNLVLALVVVAVAEYATIRPRRIWSLGLAGFAASSLACALAPSLGLLIAARCLQAVGGAMIVAAAIELLARSYGSHREAAIRWGAAGTAGLALGPALGGILTELLSWESIFLLQAPLVMLLAAARLPDDVTEAGPEGEQSHAPEIALGLISAGLTAALFLLVILLTEGWGLSPIEAAIVISVIPAATLLADRIPIPDPRSASYAAAGTISVAGGLAALGVLPGASADLAIAPQILVGVGLALALPVLTKAALGDSDPHGLRGARTIAARHAGIVVGIVLLTPVLTWQLESQEDAGRAAGTALLLDAPLSPATKLAVAEGVDSTISSSDGQLPEISEAFDGVPDDPAEQAALAELEAGIADQLERAATNAFSLPFLGAAALAALALLPLLRIARIPLPPIRRRPGA